MGMKTQLQHFEDTFQVLPELQAIRDQLIADCPEFQHLQRVRAPVVLSQRALVERGRAVPVVVLHGETVNSGVNATTRMLNGWLRAAWLRPWLQGYEPDFLIVVDVAHWEREERTLQEQLLYHALCHIEQKENEYGAPKFHDDGRPMLRLRAHDIERFAAELDRYGSVLKGFDDESGLYAKARAKEQRWRPRAV